MCREGFIVNAHPFPHDRSSHDLETVFTSPYMAVKAVSLRPEEPEAGPSQPRRMNGGPQGASSAAVDWDPVSTIFRPTQLSRDKLDEWQNMVVSDMFGRQVRRPLPIIDRDENRTPFAVGKRFSPAKADTRYPLPLPPPEDRHVDMAYICHTPEVRGKFDAKRAAELKVPNGPVRGRLTKGETVEVDDASAPGGKRIVRPEDCMSGGRPGSVRG